MIRLIWSIFLSIALTSNSYADDVISLSKGEASPYTGILFPKDQADQMRVQLLERDTFKAMYDSAQKSIDYYKTDEEYNQKKLTIISEQNDKLASSLYTERQSSEWSKIMWFSLGVVATGLAVYGASQLQK